MVAELGVGLVRAGVAADDDGGGEEGEAVQSVQGGVGLLLGQIARGADDEDGEMGVEVVAGFVGLDGRARGVFAVGVGHDSLQYVPGWRLGEFLG